ERDAVSTLKGREEALRATLAKRDRDALARALDAASRTLREVEARLGPQDASPPLEEARATATAAQEAEERAKAELGRLQGQLLQVGGGVAEEQRQEAAEGYARAARALEQRELEEEAFKLLAETLKEAEQQAGQHLGEALAAPVGERFAALLRAADAADRYGRVRFGAKLGSPEIEVAGEAHGTTLLSVGTREQLGALLRLVVAERLGTFLVLDDLLTQTDPSRVAWFRALLREVADEVQVIVLTCHPDDYLEPEDRPAAGEAMRERAAGLLRALDARQLVTG
ncbi:MAG: hypothetical protein AAGH15_16635, partial [Myxococcota bacterium]